MRVYVSKVRKDFFRERIHFFLTLPLSESSGCNMAFYSGEADRSIKRVITDKDKERVTHVCMRI